MNRKSLRPALLKKKISKAAGLSIPKCSTLQGTPCPALRENEGWRLKKVMGLYQNNDDLHLTA